MHSAKKKGARNAGTLLRFQEPPPSSSLGRIERGRKANEAPVVLWCNLRGTSQNEAHRHYVQTASCYALCYADEKQDAFGKKPKLSSHHLDSYCHRSPSLFMLPSGSGGTRATEDSHQVSEVGRVSNNNYSALAKARSSSTKIAPAFTRSSAAPLDRTCGETRLSLPSHAAADVCPFLPVPFPIVGGRGGNRP